MKVQQESKWHPNVCVRPHHGPTWGNITGNASHLRWNLSRVSSHLKVQTQVLVSGFSGPPLRGKTFQTKLVVESVRKHTRAKDWTQVRLRGGEITRRPWNHKHVKRNSDFTQKHHQNQNRDSDPSVLGLSRLKCLFELGLIGSITLLLLMIQRFP